MKRNLPKNLDPNAPPKGWQAADLWPYMMGLLSQRDHLVKQVEEGSQQQMFGGEFGSQRAVGGLTLSAATVVGGTLIPMLVAMFGEDAQEFELFGMTMNTEGTVSVTAWILSMIAHYYGVPWSHVLLAGSNGAVVAFTSSMSREFGAQLALPTTVQP